LSAVWEFGRAGEWWNARYAHSARVAGEDAGRGWFCGFYRCDVAYFNLFGGVVLTDELKGPVYPHDANAPICACFGVNYDDVVADVDDGVPSRIRSVVARAKAGESGRSAMPHVGGGWSVVLGSTAGALYSAEIAGRIAGP
jgi:hypothetical protein